jgi:hypothetical protein
VGDGISVLVGVKTAMPGVVVSVTMVGKAGGSSIRGVAVTMPGVRDGIGVHTGNGWGGTPQVSHAESKIERTRKEIGIFFILQLYLQDFCAHGVRSLLTSAG